MWYTNSVSDDGEKLGAFDYISMAMTKLANDTDPGKNKFLLKKAAAKNAEVLVDAVANYSKVHQELFGKYDGELFLRPAPYAFYNNVSGTFKDFLVRENLTILTPVLEILHTAQGYGYLDEVGAIYGLMWNTPELLISGALRLLEADKSPYSFFAFKEGFEKIWSTIVDQENLDIQYNIDIINIARSHYGTYIHYAVGDSVYLHSEWCDFLIWTPPMTEMLKVLTTAASHEEHHYFGHMHPEIYSVSILSSTSPENEEAHTYYRENIVNKTNHGVIGDLNIRNVFGGSRSRRQKRSWDNFAGIKDRKGKQLGWGNKRKGKQNQAKSQKGGASTIKIVNQNRRGKQLGWKNKRKGKQSQANSQKGGETTIKIVNQNRRGKQLGRNNKRKGKQSQSENGGDKTIKIVYQIGRNYSNEAELNKLAKEHYSEGFGEADIDIFNTISWPYFHRWNAYEVMKGNHWDVFSLQGVYRTWYAGSSVCFESVKSVLEYNNLLLRQSAYQESELLTNVYNYV